MPRVVLKEVSRRFFRIKWKETIIQLLLLTQLVGFVWIFLWSTFGDDALPGGTIFSYFVLFLTSFVGGIIAKLLHLPPLIGMLFAGIIVRNSHSKMESGFRQDWSSTLQYVALTIILLRAGLGINLSTLKKLGITTFLLASIPCIVEASTVAICAVLLLQYSWDFAFILGFIVAAVSPAVIVPMMLLLKSQRYGEEKGITTLILAAASLDDVIAIMGFGISLGLAFSTGSLWLNILHGPIDLLGGLGAGVVVTFVFLFPFRKHMSHVVKALLFVTLGLVLLLGALNLGHVGGGALATITMATITAHFWKPLENSSQPFFLSKWLELAWKVAQPAYSKVLFGIVGAALSFSSLRDGSAVGKGILVLAIAIVISCTFLVVSFGDYMQFKLKKKNAEDKSKRFSIKEKIFVAIAWLPKATVQASIGAVPLYYAQERDVTDEQLRLLTLRWAEQILAIAVLAILLTAPFGAVLIKFLGERWLERPEEAIEEEDTGRSDDYKYVFFD